MVMLQLQMTQLSKFMSVNRFSRLSERYRLTNRLWVPPKLLTDVGPLRCDKGPKIYISSIALHFNYNVKR